MLDLILYVAFIEFIGNVQTIAKFQCDFTSLASIGVSTESLPGLCDIPFAFFIIH